MYDRVITNTLKELSEKRVKLSCEIIKLSAARLDIADVLEKHVLWTYTFVYDFFSGFVSS